MAKTPSNMVSLGTKAPDFNLPDVTSDSYVNLNDIKGFNVPTCIVWGKQDEVTPPEVAEKFHQLLPSSELYWIDKCGHAAMMEHPEKFNTILMEWLSEN